MSRMRHLLRKLHIGGGGSSSGGVDHQPHHDPHPHQHQRLGGEARRNPSPMSASSSRARAQDADADPAEAVESREGSRSDGAAIAGPDFSLFEEEYQMQLALAISTSDPDGLEDADSVQIKAAKRMSLGCPPGVGAAAGAVVGVGADDDSSMEFLSLRYWSYNVVNYDEKLLDGFYVVYGFSSVNIVEKIPSLVDLQAISISDKIDYEVVLVNRTFDFTLQQLEKQAASILMESKPEEHGLLASGLVQKIADLVVCNMGGPVDDANDIQRKWTLRSSELRNSLNTIVLPLGSLEIGLSRHRTLLFKVLADRINLPCKLVKGSCYTGTDEGAVNFIKVDYGSEYIVDLMGAPGTLIPMENPSTHMENSRNFLLGPETIEQTVQDLCLVLNKVNSQFERKIFEGDLDNSLPSGYYGLQLEERSNLVNRHYNVDDLVVNSQIAGCDIEPGNLCSFLSRPQLDTSKPTEVISSSQQMKVNDVSKYVVTAAKNPEFAQKLHAVLLESGASPPPDLFSDLNSSLNLVEQDYNIDIEATGGRIGLELTGMNTTTNIQTSISPALTAERSNNSDMAKPNENVPEESVHKMGEDIASTRMSSSLAKKNDWLIIPNFQVNGSLPDDSWTKYSDPILDNLVMPKTSFMKEVGTSPVPDVVESINKGGASIGESSGLHYFQENLERDSAPDGHQKVPFEDCQDSAKGSMFKQKNILHALDVSGNEKSSKIHDAVSEWEIHWEDLQIGERIGLGSYGEVYRADWNGTEVAVKKFLNQALCGDALEQFRYEVKIMSRLRHPNVVLYMGAVTRPPNLSILTEFLPRGSLYRLLHRPNSQLDEKRRLKMALDVAKGMNYLHSSHPTIVHRDLKSPNLLVDKNWVVKVCDFGLSRLKHHTFLSSKSTSGTPEWMAPEVLLNEPSNEKCDVYSFGVILWELATLRKPWSGMNSMQVVGAVGFQNRRLEIPNDIDPVVAQIITDCWESDPNKRPSFSQLLSPLKKMWNRHISGPPPLPLRVEGGKSGTQGG